MQFSQSSRRGVDFRKCSERSADGANNACKLSDHFAYYADVLKLMWQLGEQNTQTLKVIVSDNKTFCLQKKANLEQYKNIPK